MRVVNIIKRLTIHIGNGRMQLVFFIVLRKRQLAVAYTTNSENRKEATVQVK